MAITPESLVRHELVGLTVRVSGADNDDAVGIEGTVVAETTNTLGIERDGDDTADSDRVSHVPKDGTTFTFTLPGERAGEVTVEGRRLVTRPPRRTENTSDSKWR